MQTIKDLLTLYKSYGKELKIIKIMVLIIINIWLLFIFWKIIALDGFTILEERTNTIETRLETITGGVTPRPSGMFRSPTLNIRTNNDNL